MSPAIDFLLENKKKNQEITVLLSGVSDIRHILKTCSDHATNKEQISLKIYIHEKQKEQLCRDLLFFLILHCDSLSYREKMELFFDIYGNIMVREASRKYIDHAIVQLISLVSDQPKHKTPLKDLISLKEIKYKQIDEFVDIFNSWNSKVPFEVEKLHDQRLRYIMKDRYDYRINLFDWDYQMGIKEETPIVHWVHYRDWRKTGVAFEQRFSTYTQPNRTLSSYIRGNKKITRESCLVRGYWQLKVLLLFVYRGDMIVSPYIGFGVDTDYEPEKTEFFKLYNQQIAHNEVEISEFNLTYYLNMLDTLKEFRAEIKDPYGGYKEIAKGEEEEEKKLETIKEEEDEEKSKVQNSEKAETKNSQQEFTYSKILTGFKNLKLEIVLLCEDPNKLGQKAKYQNMFDIAVIGFVNSLHLDNKDFLKLFKEKCQVYAETPKFYVPIKKEEKKELAGKLKDIMVNQDFDILNYYQFSNYHILGQKPKQFTKQKEEQSEKVQQSQVLTIKEEEESKVNQVE